MIRELAWDTPTVWSDFLSINPHSAHCHSMEIDSRFEQVGRTFRKHPGPGFLPLDFERSVFHNDSFFLPERDGEQRSVPQSLDGAWIRRSFDFE